MKTEEAGRKILVQKLSELLGFEDGASDVLEHLIGIESTEDLVDYLSQLLGISTENNDTIRQFAESIGRFQRGESVEETAAGGPADAKNNNNSSSTDDKRSDATTIRDDIIYTQSSKTKKKKNRSPTRPQRGGSKSPPRQGGVGKGRSAKNNNNQSASKDAPSQAKIIPNKAPNNEEAPAAAAAATPKEELVEGNQQSSPPPPKLRPTRGKATFECGCFGTVHKPLTNCLYCGRISCEREGYNFCPFCGYLVEEVKPLSEVGDVSKDPAWRHKERLLRFDREFAQRTVILDDQEDYYTSQSSAWLTAEERAEAKENEDESVKKKHYRGNMELKLTL